MVDLAAWAPYFDNMDAIIFLAPISGFDEVRRILLFPDYELTVLWIF